MRQRTLRAVVSAGIGISLVASTMTTGIRDVARAANSASVTINVGTPLASIPPAASGLNTAVWDANLLDTSVPGLLQQAGVTMLRYPGGSTSDAYHWQTNSITPGQGGYANPNNTFDAFMKVAQQTGAQPIITVNYGSNAAGNGGGDPTEAAAWVRYANVTKGYGVKYWEIGNEIYGNGEYGSAWETDLHTDHSPTAYANNSLTFIGDMKAVDPTIKVGVVLTAPGNWPDGVAPDWNSNVLSVACSQIDFVIVHWYPQAPGSESDAGLLGTTSQIAGMVSGLKSKISQYCGTRAGQIGIFVTETNSVYSNPGKQSVSLVNGLFLADNYTTWLENGVANVDWWDLHNAATAGNSSSSLYGTTTYGDYGILSNGTSAGGQTEPPAETPFPPYYGLQMLTYLGKSGDQLVSTSSSQSLVAVHAVKQANGNLAVLLINKDPSNSYAVNISLNGYTPAASGTVYSYGENSTAITSSSVSGLGAGFTQTIAPYSLTTVVLSPGSSGGPTGTPTNSPTQTPSPSATATATATSTSTTSGTPTFSQSSTVSRATIKHGSSTTIKTTVTDTSGALTNGIVDIEVYNASGQKVGQQYFTGQNLATGQSTTQSYTWTAPATTGTYTVKVGVFGPNWSPNYFWANSAATIKVT